ncbi:MAG: hypothetical protein EOS26_10345 [Mesorhizobium sp.]|nr:MAG: hypothetical protein EOS26_10345 [Mesorhizobium sp.]
MTRNHSQAYERVAFVVVESTNDRIARAAERDGLEIGEWLRLALDRELKLSEEGGPHGPARDGKDHDQ